MGPFLPSLSSTASLLRLPVSWRRGKERGGGEVIYFVTLSYLLNPLVPLVGWSLGCNSGFSPPESSSFGLALGRVWSGVWVDCLPGPHTHAHIIPHIHIYFRLSTPLLDYSPLDSLYHLVHHPSKWVFGAGRTHTSFCWSTVSDILIWPHRSINDLYKAHPFFPGVQRGGFFALVSCQAAQSVENLPHTCSVNQEKRAKAEFE